MKSYPQRSIRSDNVLKFDAEGNLLFKTGLLKLARAVSGERKFEVSGLSIENGQLHLEYDSIGYEAWADMETGRMIGGRFKERK